MGKTALITGATAGLGYEFVKLFARDGVNLVLVARGATRLEEIRKTFAQVKVTVISKDLSVAGAAKEVWDEVERQGIEVDFLVNNAGFGLAGKFDELDIQKQMQMIQLHVAALTELTHYALSQMKPRRQGRILNVASTAAFQPGPMMAVYFATKAFVLSFTEALAEELAGSGVTVTTLCPGPTKTNFFTAANMEKSRMFSMVASSPIVAEKGYQAMMKGKRVVVTGGLNQAMALSVRWIPRSAAAKIARYIVGEK